MKEKALAALKQKEINLKAKIDRIPQTFTPEHQPEALARAQAGLVEVQKEIRDNKGKSDDKKPA